MTSRGWRPYRGPPRARAGPRVGAAHDFYSLDGAQRLREALRTFRGGRILVGVAGIPYKCPPAPVEFTLMLEQYLRQRGVRERSEVTLLSPLNRAFTIESASKLVQPIMDRRGIHLATFFNVEEVDPPPARWPRWRARRPNTTC
jgi:sulfide:quinone oxidoreductase